MAADYPDPQWPSVGPNGIAHFAPDHVLPMRKYTIRRIDVAGGFFDVDLVLHDDAGPGSSFALRAKPGDVIGMVGRSVPLDRDWYLLAGDETALPAIGRILATLPASARGIALVEVADAAEIQQLHTNTNIEIQWLSRDGSTGGTTNLLPDVVQGVELPTDGSSVYVWSACESAAFKMIRSNIRKQRKLGKDDSHIVSYWLRGKADAGEDHD